MKFGMIGAGTLAQAIAGHVVKAGHDVVFSNSRGPHTLGAVAGAFGPHASAGTVAEAGAADLVVLAVPWTQVRDAVRSLPAREGRIVIDATNQWARLTPAFVADRLDDKASKKLFRSVVEGFGFAPRRPRPAPDGPPDAGGRRTPERTARHPGRLKNGKINEKDRQKIVEKARRSPGQRSAVGNMFWEPTSRLWTADLDQRLQLTPELSGSVAEG